MASTKPIIVGISGKLGSGKDTLGGFISDIAQQQGYTIYRRAFGDALKEEIATFLSTSSFPEILDFLDRHATDADTEAILADTFIRKPKSLGERFKAAFGWWPTIDYRGQNDDIIAAMHDRARKESFRRLMIWWGTEFRRKQTSETYWTETLEHWVSAISKVHEGEKILFWIPDDRFLSEQKCLEKLGAFTIRINRPSAAEKLPDSIRYHQGEIELDNYRQFHAVVLNEDITLEELKFAAAQVWGRCLVYTYGSAPA